MGEFYGFKPEFGLGQKVYVNLAELNRVYRGIITGITFELIDEEALEVTMYYEVEEDGSGRLYCVDESCLTPLTALLPTVAALPPAKEDGAELDYSEYTTDELLDAYNTFKSADGFDYVIRQITDELKRR
jgi:hypothetical protein